MGYLSHRVDPHEIKPGDHIYTWRTAFTYAHHGLHLILNPGIYVGENKVIHFTAPGSDSGWNLSSSIPSSCLNSIDSGFSLPKSEQNCDIGTPLSTYKCGFQKSESGVIVSCLSCFIGSGSLYLYQYGVNKCSYVSKLRGGTCTTAQSDPPKDVIDKAHYLLLTGFGKYNVVKNNCEDFALYCKTGLLVSGKPATGSSGQVNFILNAPWKTIVSSALPKLVYSGTGAVTVALAVGTLCLNRYNTDIGVRGDVVKVQVEDVGSFLGGK